MKVWINGCFDVLHFGHFEMLKFARNFSKDLIIGIDSDERIKKFKGNKRPYHNQNQRKFNLKNLKGVRKVYIFGSDYDLKKILKKIKPDIMVIGDDYRGKKIIGRKFIKKIVYFKNLRDENGERHISSSKIIDQGFNEKNN